MTALNQKKRLYSIIVSGENFDFTKDQLESDPENYFTTFFFGDFAEAANGCKELVIEKEPKLFRLIQAHLRGYTILPLSPSSIPHYMTGETTMINLLVEAQYYGLRSLVEKIEEYQRNEEKSNASPGAVNRPSKRYKLSVSVQRGAK
jgi:hypothetical protein